MIKESDIIELLERLYNFLECECIDLGFDVLENDIIHYPRLQHILEKIHLTRGGTYSPTI